MHSFTITAAFAGLLALTSAASPQLTSASPQPSDSPSDSADKLCFPTDKQGKPDFSAPCNQQEKLIAEGVYGKSFDSIMNSDSQNDPTPVANKTQLSYFCGGDGAQIWDLTSGYVTPASCCLDASRDSEPIL
jgi:hypothetical protein